ncbi:MAG: hypothetical protein H6R18_991 [Proteobacteria bacterium]|nr:hypothetical protein [Pseudomonadota bacterium]
MFGLARKKKEGWLAVGLFADRIDVAHVERPAGARPRLVRLESYARSGDDAAALSALAKQKNLAAYRITTLLAHDSYQLLSVDAPDVPEAELREGVRWRLKDMVDFPVDAAMLDVLPSPVGQMAGRAPTLLAAIVSNTALAPRMAAFDKAKLDLQAVDIAEQAQRNIAALFEDENRGLVMLGLDESGGMLTFTYRGELCVARHIEVTTKQLEAADESRRSALLERIGLELQRSIDNFERQYTSISVSKIVVGPCPSAPGLVEYLRDYVYIPIVAADLATVIDCDGVPEISNPNLQAERLQVIGAALRDESAERGQHQVNLLNPSLRASRDWLALPLVVGLGVAIVAVLALFYGLAARERTLLLKEETALTAEAKNLQTQVETLAKVVAERKPNADLARQATTLRAMLAPRQEVVQRLKAFSAQDAGFGAYWRGFAQQALEGVWLTEFFIGKSEILIRGRLSDPALLPAYIRRLNGEKAFQGRNFATLEMKAVEAQAPAPAAVAVAGAARAATTTAAPLLPRYTEFTLQSTPAAPKTGAGG